MTTMIKSQYLALTTDVYGMGEVKVEFKSDWKTNKPGFLCYYERVTVTELVGKYNVECVCLK